MNEDDRPLSTPPRSTTFTAWREQFREDNRILTDICRRIRLGKIWMFTGTLTMASQARYRFDHDCTDAAACTISMAKGLVWSVLWPAYWIMKATDFVVAHAILGNIFGIQH
jgi:hypothetical protein